jgi:hypothetical protein
MIQLGEGLRLLVHEGDGINHDGVRVHRGDHLLDVGLRPLDPAVRVVLISEQVVPDSQELRQFPQNSST